MDQVNNILVALLEEIKIAITEAQRGLESLATKGAKNAPVTKKHAPVSIDDSFRRSVGFRQLAEQLNADNELTAAVLITAATFPAEQFVTLRALKERMQEYGFNFKPYAVMQTVSRLKRNYNYGKKGEHIQIQPLMDNFRINWKTSEAMALIDAKNIKPSQAKSPQYALRINAAGRAKAANYLAMIGLEDDSIIIAIQCGQMD